MEKDAFDRWARAVPETIRQDALWSLQVYQLALFASDLAEEDAARCEAHADTSDIGCQIRRSVSSISANISEGFGRSGHRDRARFLEYALGSSREGRDWYYKARRIIGTDRADAGMILLSRITQMLLKLIQRERERDATNQGAPASVYRS